jgi:hypothetical protein
MVEESGDTGDTKPPTSPDDDATPEATGLRQRIEEMKQRAAKAKEQARAAQAVLKEKTNPVRTTLGTQMSRKRWSFVWAMATSWLIGPQFLLALWDRLILIADRPELLSGDQPMNWGLLHGPGRWFRDALADHWEHGNTGRLLLAAVCGIAPLLLAAAHGENRKLGRLYFYGLLAVPVLYLIGVSYWSWPLAWTDIYMAMLAGTAWYCTLWAKEKEPGLTRMLLMVPLASVVSGILAYSPGAAF